MKHFIGMWVLFAALASWTHISNAQNCTQYSQPHAGWDPSVYIDDSRINVFFGMASTRGVGRLSGTSVGGLTFQDWGTTVGTQHGQSVGTAPAWIRVDSRREAAFVKAADFHIRYRERVNGVLVGSDWELPANAVLPAWQVPLVTAIGRPSVTKTGGPRAFYTGVRSLNVFSIWLKNGVWTMQDLGGTLINNVTAVDLGEGIPSGPDFTRSTVAIFGLGTDHAIWSRVNSVSLTTGDETWTPWTRLPLPDNGNNAFYGDFAVLLNHAFGFATVRLYAIRQVVNVRTIVELTMTPTGASLPFPGTSGAPSKEIGPVWPAGLVTSDLAATSESNFPFGGMIAVYIGFPGSGEVTRMSTTDGVNWTGQTATLGAGNINNLSTPAAAGRILVVPGATAGAPTSICFW